MPASNLPAGAQPDPADTRPRRQRLPPQQLRVTVVRSEERLDVADLSRALARAILRAQSPARTGAAFVNPHSQGQAHDL
jgi:hypothetical protein